MISIRPLYEQDAYTSYKWRNDPEVFAQTTITYAHSISLESELAWIRRVTARTNDYRCAILVDGIYVGNVYLTDIKDGVGTYHIFIGEKSYWGKGVAFEASNLIINYGFEQLDLHKILLDVRVENQKAIALYRKMGFIVINEENSIFKMSLERPLVSIVCLTYNEEDFVRDCFDSFLMQKTSFPFEVLVYDDASTDNTPKIIQEYASKYPNIFRPILYKENNFQKGLGFLGVREGFREARGKYIAYCEGDDYWCDNKKLQKQVDFLESHPDFEVCAHETRIRNDFYPSEDGRLFSTFDVNLFLDRTKQNVYTLADTLTGNIYHVSSMMFRKMEFNWPSWITQIKAMDMVVFMMQAERGDIYYMRDVMSVYRTRNNSITSSGGDFKSAITFYGASIKILRLMNRYWERQYQHLIYPIIARYYMRSMFVCLSKSGRDYALSRKMAKKAWLYDKSTFVKYLWIESYRKLKKHL